MLFPEVVMNLLPEVRDCVGYAHNHSPLIRSNRNSHFERLWRVSRQSDHTITEVLIKSGDSVKSRAITQEPMIAPSVAKPSAFRPV